MNNKFFFPILGILTGIATASAGVFICLSTSHSELGGFLVLGGFVSFAGGMVIGHDKS